MISKGVGMRWVSGSCCVRVFGDTLRSKGWKKFDSLDFLEIVALCNHHWSLGDGQPLSLDSCVATLVIMHGCQMDGLEIEIVALRLRCGHHGTSVNWCANDSMLLWHQVLLCFVGDNPLCKCLCNLLMPVVSLAKPIPKSKTYPQHSTMWDRAKPIWQIAIRHDGGGGGPGGGGGGASVFHWRFWT
jgi:hypothetical protein